MRSKKTRWAYVPANDRNTTKLYRRGPHRDNDGAFDWDVTRPIAEQWPWNGHPTREAHEAHMAKGDAMLDEAMLTKAEAAEVIAQSSDSYAPYDLDSVCTAIQDLKSCGALTGRTLEGVSVPARETAPDAFSAVDTASREPWRADGETQPSDADETQLRQATCDGPDGEPARHGVG